MTCPDKLQLALAGYLDTNRATGLPVAASFPIRAGAHDSPQDIPCASVYAEAPGEEFVPLRNTWRIGVTVRVRCEAKDTTIANARLYAGYLAEKLADVAALRTAINKPGGTDSRTIQAFHLYDLFFREGSTTQDGTDFVCDMRYEAIATGHDVG